MDIQKLLKLDVVREMFPTDENGEMAEGTRLLLNAMEEVCFPPGKEIVRYGEPGDDGMYIILEGRAQVLNGRGEQINSCLETGSLVGEMALIRDEPRSATVRTVTPVCCAHLSNVQFEEAARSNKKLYGALLSLLYKKNTDLAQEQIRLHSELEIAARIQTGILRHDFTAIENRMGIGIAASMHPAKEVGGDFYDVFQVTPRKVCIVIADVSGKGVPAAMFMAMAKTHIKNYGMLDMPLEELAYRVNNQLCEDNPEEMFVTAFIGLLDMDTGRFSFVNAGHNRPYLAAGSGEFGQVMCQSDLVLGLWENRTYREQTLDFRRGGRFFLYTDGVTEAENESGELFGDDRLCKVLNRHEQETDPRNLTTLVLKDLKTYAGAAEQTDDITMLYVTVSGDSFPAEKGEAHAGKDSARPDGIYGRGDRGDGRLPGT